MPAPFQFLTAIPANIRVKPSQHEIWLAQLYRLPNPMGLICFPLASPARGVALVITGVLVEYFPW